MTIERRLTTIVAADLAGYSRLMAADEEGVIQRLRDCRAQVIDPAVAGAGGRIVKTMGDGLLIEFSSPVEAVRGALTIQNEMRDRETTRAEDQRLRFRVGVHLGDVITDGDDILGDAVNVAARLETLAPVGGMCISKTVEQQVRGRLDAELTSLGAQMVKNMPEPVDVWRVEVEGATIVSAPSEGRGRPSLVILPFDNMSADPDQDFLADGIVEDVTTELSRFRGLFVIARNTAFTYRGAGKDIKTIAKELGVSYVVEGSVRRAGQRLRVTAQLIEAETGSHVWADRFDRTMEDLFDLQDELTAAIVSNVAPEIGAHERRIVARKPTQNLSAWELVHRGYAEQTKYTLTAFAAAEEYYKAALVLDPNHALPYTYMARMTAYSYLLRDELDSLKSGRKGLLLAEKAVSLDDRSDEAYGALSQCLGLLRRTGESIAAAQKGLTINRNNALLHHYIGIAALNADDATGYAEMIVNCESEALKLSPNDPISTFFFYTRATGYLLLDGQDRDCSALNDFAASARLPNSPWFSFSNAAQLYSMHGDMENAGRMITNALQAKPNLTYSFIRDLSLAHPAFSKLWPSLEDATKALVPLGLPER